MQFIVDNIAHEIPLNLPDITLGRFVNYYDAYGRDLDNELKELMAKDYKNEGYSDDELELHKEIILDDHLDKEGVAWISFWTEKSKEQITKSLSIVPLLNQYRTLRAMLNETEAQEKTIPFEVTWRGDAWSVQDYKVNASSLMDFNEIITSKEIIRQVNSVGKGRWDALPYLCAVFFRKNGEAFNDQFVIEDGERMKIINELPLEYALKVSFFLKSCVSIWRSTSACLAKKAVAVASLN